jgi:hypothetical protein
VRGWVGHGGKNWSNFFLGFGQPYTTLHHPTPF